MDTGASSRNRWRPAAAAACGALAFCAAFALARGDGWWHVNVPWNWYQLLDAEALRARPWSALLYLHSQPPLLNASLAALLRIESWTGLRVETLATVLFACGGLVAAVALALLVLALTRSALAAAIASVLLVANPAFHILSARYFYDFPLLVLMTLLFLALHAQLRRPALGAPMWAAIGIAIATVNLRSFYSPLWAAAIAGGALAAHARLHGRPPLRRLAALCAVLAAGLCAWPAKNALVFGNPTFSSWIGYNLSRSTPLTAQPLADFLASDGAVAPGGIERAVRVRIVPGTVQDVVWSPRKRSGAVNWNHALFLFADRPLRRAALEWKLHNPRATAATAAYFYLAWCGPMYRYGYTGELLGGDSRIRRYAAAFRRVANPALREIAAPPRAIIGMPQPPPVPLGAGSLLLYPMLAALGVAMLFSLRRRFDASRAVLLLMLATLAYALAAACFSDGLEANRHRFPAYPLELACVAAAAAACLRRIAARVRARIKPGTPPD